MKIETLVAWVNGLRSGDYKQVKGPIRDGDCFCALGVLHEVRGGEWLNNGDMVNWENNSMPRKMEIDVAYINDGTSATFDEVADWIELHKDEFLETPNEN